jgi:hypothetical protein
MATFLQSLDSDLESDNIVITQETRDALANANIDLRTASEQEVQELLESIGRVYVDEDTAMEHVQEMLQQYTNMEENEFDARVSDDTQTATLGTSAPVGITFETTSGITGEIGTNGRFTFEEGDAITFFDANRNPIATIDSSDIGTDGIITMEEMFAFTEITNLSSEAVVEDTQNEDIVTTEGDNLSIVAINGQDITNGQRVNIFDASGQFLMGTAMLHNGEIEFNPAWNRDINSDEDSQEITFNYTVSDGNETEVAEATVRIDNNTNTVDETDVANETPVLDTEITDLELIDSLDISSDDTQVEEDNFIQEDVALFDTTTDNVDGYTLEDNEIEIDFDNIDFDDSIDLDAAIQNIDEDINLEVGDILHTTNDDSLSMLGGEDELPLDSSLISTDDIVSTADSFDGNADEQLQAIKMMIDSNSSTDQS